MPADETITGFADRLIELAGRVIVEAGGQLSFENGRAVYRVNAQARAAGLEEPRERVKIW